MESSDVEGDGERLLTQRSISNLDPNESKLDYQEVKSIITFIKVMKGRHMFLKLKEISDIVPLEAAAEVIPGEILSYQESIAQLLNQLLKQYLILNEVHGEVLYDLSVHPKRFQNSNSTQHMLEYKKKILDFSYQINEEMQSERKYISQLIVSNKKWCSMENELIETLNVHLRRSQDMLDSTYYLEQKKIQAKKNKKIRLIKVASEIIWGIMSIHRIDYKNNDEFRNILYRVNRAKHLAIDHNLEK